MALAMREWTTCQMNSYLLYLPDELLSSLPAKVEMNHNDSLT